MQVAATASSFDHDKHFASDSLANRIPKILQDFYQIRTKHFYENAGAFHPLACASGFS
jgi:hypothetical protein